MLEHCTHLELGAGLGGRAGGLAVGVALRTDTDTELSAGTAAGNRGAPEKKERSVGRKRTRWSSAVSSATCALSSSTVDMVEGVEEGGAEGGEGRGGLGRGRCVWEQLAQSRSSRK